MPGPSKIDKATALLNLATAAYGASGAAVGTAKAMHGMGKTLYQRYRPVPFYKKPAFQLGALLGTVGAGALAHQAYEAKKQQDAFNVIADYETQGLQPQYY